MFLFLYLYLINFTPDIQYPRYRFDSREKFALLLVSFMFLKSQLVRAGEGEEAEPKLTGQLRMILNKVDPVNQCEVFYCFPQFLEPVPATNVAFRACTLVPHRYIQNS